MASKDGGIANFEPRGKTRPNHPMPPIHEKTVDHHLDDAAHASIAWQQQQQQQQQQQTVQHEPQKGPEGPSSTGCLVCGVDDDHANMLLCEECNGEFHTYCLTPKLDAVPEYDWFCARCRPEAGDRLEERVCALPRSYTSRFGEICWAQGGVGYGWWPACIYDPRMTMGGARMQALKHLGKRYLVFFFQCSDTPSFEILTMNKLMSWEQGLAESFQLGKTARTSGKTRHGQFRKALQEAAIEESLPKERRLDWNHQGGGAGNAAQGGGGISLPLPKKVGRGRKRRRAENTTTTSDNGAPPVATATSVKNNSVGGTAGPPSFARVVEKKTARRSLSFTLSTQPNPPAGQSASTDTNTSQADNLVRSTKSKSAANVNISSAEHVAPKPDEQQQLPAEHVAPELKVRQPPASAATIVATTQDESANGEMYCKIQREIRVKVAEAAPGKTSASPLSTDDSTSALPPPVLLDVGFVRLDSRQTATFADCREVIEEELASDGALPLNWEWRFLVPTLGPLSKKQESKFGPMLAFLKNAAPSLGEQTKNNVGSGSLQNPVQITLVDAPHVQVIASG